MAIVIAASSAALGGTVWDLGVSFGKMASSLDDKLRVATSHEFGDFSIIGVAAKICSHETLFATDFEYPA